jgi:CBS domain-containing protein
MARTIDEIMNTEILSVPPELPAREVPPLLRSFGVSAAPVLDDDGRPIGVVSLRDVLDTDRRARDVMTRPAACVSMSATIEAAAAQVARGNRHRLVVVDGTGAAVGMLSTLDVLRALLDVPTRHPEAFPHWDASTGTSWTDDWPLEEESHGRAPDGPGVLVILTDHLGLRGAIVWVEACANVRLRVREYATRPARQEPPLARALSRQGLRFRASHVEDPSSRAGIAAVLQKRLEHVPPPGET